MKRLALISMATWLLVLLGCQSDKEERVQEMALQVEGMVCEYGCARYIEKQVAGLSGVKECMVDFDKHTAIVSFNSNEISADDIKSTITGLNEGQYKVEEMDLLEKKESKKTSTSEKSKASASPANVAFEFPQLITYFMKHIVR